MHPAHVFEASLSLGDATALATSDFVHWKTSTCRSIFRSLPSSLIRTAAVHPFFFSARVADSHAGDSRPAADRESH